MRVLVIGDNCVDITIKGNFKFEEDKNIIPETPQKGVTKKVLENIIIDVIKTIYDPEIPVNIYELGLIYEVNIDDDFNAEIIMTLTTPNCPVAESMPMEVESKVAGISYIKSAKVEITFEPAWDKSMMSEEALLDLGFM